MSGWVFNRRDVLTFDNLHVTDRAAGHGVGVAPLVEQVGVVGDRLGIIVHRAPVRGVGGEGMVECTYVCVNEGKQKKQ